MPDRVQQLMKETDRRMLEAIDAVKHEFDLIRTGRANPAILDRVRVEYYGQMVPIKQVGTVTVPEPRLLMIQPWDKQTIKPIMDAITSSDLGLNPMSDGNVIRVPLPQLTTERRQELAKLVARKTEQYDNGIGICMELAKKYPESDKVDDAAAYIAYFHKVAGRPNEAIAACEDYLQRWPEGDDADWAAKQIKEIKASMKKGG